MPHPIFLPPVRTTLTIDDDVLAAAKAIAERQHKSLGEVISELSRRALHPAAKPRAVRNGVPLLPVSKASVPVTADLVNQLREDLS